MDKQNAHFEEYKPPDQDRVLKEVSSSTNTTSHAVSFAIGVGGALVILTTFYTISANHEKDLLNRLLEHGKGVITLKSSRSFRAPGGIEGKSELEIKYEP